MSRSPRPNQSGWTPLIYAAYRGNLEISNMLLARGARVNATAANGYTALMMAAREGHENIAALLLKHGALRTTTNELGEDAMKWAMRNGNLSVAKLIASEDEFAQAAAKPPVPTPRKYTRVSLRSAARLPPLMRRCGSAPSTTTPTPGLSRTPSTLWTTS